MLSYFAGSTCGAAVNCVLELLRFLVRLGLLHKVKADAALSDSVSPDDSPNDSEFDGKAEDWVWGRDPVNFATLFLEYSPVKCCRIYPKSPLGFGSDDEM